MGGAEAMMTMGGQAFPLALQRRVTNARTLKSALATRTPMSRLLSNTFRTRFQLKSS